MNARIKIDYERGLQNHPVIKIIRPAENKLLPTTPGSNEDIEEDVQDRLVTDLLHSPCKVDPNEFFEIKSNFPVDGGPRITTIGAIQEEDILYRFRHAILNRYVPYNDIVDINRDIGLTSRITSDVFLYKKSRNQYFELFQRIHQFFNWLDETKQAAWVERHPYIGDGKLIPLKEVGIGNRFTFGGVDFSVDKVNSSDPTLLLCQIDGKEAYAYIADHTIVEIEN